MKYDIPNYAESRLNGTVVMDTKAGKPVLVKGIDDDWQCTVMSITGGDDYEVEYAHLDVTPVKLGYVNIDSRPYDALYLVRMPKRNDWRQGLRRENMIVLSKNLDSGRVPFKYLSNCILGEYPTFEAVVECFVKNAGKFISMAWCRDFCLYTGGKVLYRTIHVGDYSVDSGVVLLDEYTYLQEVLNESM